MRGTVPPILVRDFKGIWTMNHGYPNLNNIQRALADLHRLFPGQDLLGHRFPSAISPSLIDAACIGDPVIAIQRAASTIVHHFGLLLASIVVLFVRDLGCAARISVQSDGTGFIEMDNEFREARQHAVAVLAHEIAHLFLAHAGLRYPSTHDNEVLTDTTSIYLGAGWSQLNTFRRVKTTEYKVVGLFTRRFDTVIESGMGYLTPQEVGYVLSRRMRLTAECIDKWIVGAHPRRMLRLGRGRMRAELRQPPSLQQSWLETVLYRTRVKRMRLQPAAQRAYRFYALENSVKGTCIVFRCQRCASRLRLPAGLGVAAVDCPSCKNSIDYWT